MKWKKIATLGCVFVMSMSLMTGCGEQEIVEEKTPVVSEEPGDILPENRTVTVRVTAVEGDTIIAEAGTMSVRGRGGAPGGMPEGEAPEGEPGEPPEGGAPGGSQGNGIQVMPGVEEAQGGPFMDQPGELPGGEGPEDEPGEPPEGGAPEGEPGEPPEGGAPEGGPGELSGEGAPDDIMGGGINFSSSGEIITFTLTDSTGITVEYLQGSGEATAEEIVLGSVLEVTLDADNYAVAVAVMNLSDRGDFGGSSEMTNGTAANIIDKDGTVSGKTYTSTGDDENALRVDGARVTLNEIAVEKNGGASSNTEDGDFYGQNAGLLALNGAEVTINRATVNTSAVNGNGVFSYGEGTVVNISDSVIRTTENNSGGIQTTGGGITNAANLDVETQGTSAAAIRSDRGGGEVNVDGGTYITNGTGSPTIYCTADIAVTGARLTANASEGVVVEGKNSVSLTNCMLTGNMDNTYNGDSDENIHCIMIYQSMSGDAAVGDAYFSAEGGSIISLAGDMFYITNTDCEIYLRKVAFTLANDVFLRVEGNSSSRGWGTQGANGGDVILTADAQELRGNILVDGISSLKLSLTNGSSYSGAVNPSGTGGSVTVTLDEDSSWTLTGDSYITVLDGDIESVDANGYRLYVNGEELL